MQFKIRYTQSGHPGADGRGVIREWFYPGAPARTIQTEVCRVSGLRNALRMPPAVMAIIAKLYGEGGFPCREATPGIWRMDTPLCRVLFTEITWEGLRMRVLHIGEPGAADRWPVLFDARIRFEQLLYMAHEMTAKAASEAAELPLLFVEAAIRRITGTTPRDGDTFNGIALRACLIGYCKHMRDHYKGERGEEARDRRALWDSRAAGIARSKEKRWSYRGRYYD